MTVLTEGVPLRKIGCRLGRHAFEYLICPDDDLVRWCPRCKSPKALTIIAAKRLPGTGLADDNPQPERDRPLASLLDQDALSAAAGML